MKLAPWLILAAMVLLALGGIVWLDWSVFGLVGVAMPAIGWLALAGGVIVTIAVGGGLMFLIFFSSRRGYDDAAGGDRREEP